ncbi:hypothetical protein H2204_000929 [Knufia peltigerae]|uniref:Uncharacterized protein n=1 Tax=Knufia peltigerae TaxID=1002370 RepID=A0AA38YEE2_9EURO|nr:hypothetical protein H2204_000929 [Knufia peltigerae]
MRLIEYTNRVNVPSTQASIIGHTKHGFDKVYPAIDAIPARKEHEVGKGAAIGGWDYINASLLVAALLNWDWARSLRPRTLEDKLVIYTLSVAGALWSIRFVKVKTYLALVPLFIAPSCSLAASVLKP